MSLTENALVEQPAIELFATLGWQTLNSYHEEFGADGTLGRETTSEVVLAVRRVRPQAQVKRGRAKTKPARLLVRFLCHQVPPRGYDALANLTTSQAASRLLDWLYDGISLPEVLQPNQTQPKLIRNEEIRKRYAGGETLISIGKVYGISKQRVHQIVTEE